VPGEDKPKIVARIGRHMGYPDLNGLLSLMSQDILIWSRCVRRRGKLNAESAKKTWLDQGPTILKALKRKGHNSEIRDLGSCAEKWESAKTAEHYGQLESDYNLIVDRLDPEALEDICTPLKNDIIYCLKDAREDLEQSRRSEEFLAKHVDGKSRKSGVDPLSLQRLFRLATVDTGAAAVPYFSLDVIRGAFYEEAHALLRGSGSHNTVGNFVAAKPARAYGLLLELTLTYTKAQRGSGQLVAIRLLAFLVTKVLDEKSKEISEITFSNEALLRGFLYLGWRGTASPHPEVSKSACQIIGKIVDRLREIDPTRLGVHLGRLIDVVVPLMSHDDSSIRDEGLRILQKAVLKGVETPELIGPLTLLSDFPESSCKELNACLKRLRGDNSIRQEFSRFLDNARGGYFVHPCSSP